MRDAHAAIDRLELKTLRLLSVLLRTASVTRTAEAMGLSQPAASRAVDRLRRVLRDPLLVRTRGGYALTSRASALAPRVADLLAALDGVFSPAAFDPAQTSRSFRLATTDYGAATALPALMQGLMSQAPRARLDVLPFGPETFDKLERGELDVAFYADLPLPPDFHFRPLFRDSYACVLRASHPLARRPFRKDWIKACARYPRAVLMYTEGTSLQADDVLTSLGAEPEAIALRTPHFLAAPRLIAETDLVMCVPLRIAESMASVADLHVVPLPVEAASFGYRIIWHERTHHDPAMVWLRRLPG